MLRIPIASLSLRKQKLLANSQLSPPLFISIEGHHYDIIVKAIIYEVQVCIQSGHDVVINSIKLRFSDFEKLDQKIHNKLIKNNNAPSFPPKKWFWNTNEEFVREREEGLKEYIEYILMVPEIYEDSAFLSFFHLQY